TRCPERTSSSLTVAASAAVITWSLLDGITLPSPRVTSSTWARLAHSRKIANAAAEATMMRRAPVSGRRCLSAGPTRGSVAITTSYSKSLPAGYLRSGSPGRDHRGGRRGLALLRGHGLRGRSAALVRAGDVKGPALRRIEQSADVVRRALQHRPVGDRPGFRRRNLAGRQRRCCGRRRPHRQRVARLADIAAGEGRRLAPRAGPAIEDVLADLRHLRQQRRPARSDIIGVIVSCLADARLDVAG